MAGTVSSKLNVIRIKKKLDEYKIPYDPEARGRSIFLSLYGELKTRQINSESTKPVATGKRPNSDDGVNLLHAKRRNIVTTPDDQLSPSSAPLVGSKPKLCRVKRRCAKNPKPKPSKHRNDHAGFVLRPLRRSARIISQKGNSGKKIFDLNLQPEGSTQVNDEEWVARKRPRIDKAAGQPIKVHPIKRRPMWLLKRKAKSALVELQASRSALPDHQEKLYPSLPERQLPEGDFDWRHPTRPQFPHISLGSPCKVSPVLENASPNIISKRKRQVPALGLGCLNTIDPGQKTPTANIIVPTVTCPPLPYFDFTCNVQRNQPPNGGTFTSLLGTKNIEEKCDLIFAPEKETTLDRPQNIADAPANHTVNPVNRHFRSLNTQISPLSENDQKLINPSSKRLIDNLEFVKDSPEDRLLHLPPLTPEVVAQTATPDQILPCPSGDNNSTRTSELKSNGDVPDPGKSLFTIATFGSSAVGEDNIRTQPVLGLLEVADSAGGNPHESWAELDSTLLKPLCDSLEDEKAKITVHQSEENDSSGDNNSTRTSELKSNGDVPDPGKSLFPIATFGSSAVGEDNIRTQPVLGLLEVADSAEGNPHESWAELDSTLLKPLCDSLEDEKAKITVHQSEENDLIRVPETKSAEVPDTGVPCSLDGKSHVCAAGSETIQTQSISGLAAVANLGGSNTDRSWPDPATMPLQSLRDLLDRLGADWTLKERKPALRESCQKLINMEKAEITVLQSEDNNSIRTSGSSSTRVPDPDAPFPGDVDSHVSAVGTETTRTESTTGHMSAVADSSGINVDGSWPDPASMPLHSLRDLLDRLGADWTFKERRPALRERCQKLINMEKAKIAVLQSEDSNSTRTSGSNSTSAPDPDIPFSGDVDSHVSAAGAGTTRTQSTTGHMLAVATSGGSNVDGSWPEPATMPLQSLRDLLDRLGADWTFKERRPALRERCQKLINMEKAKIAVLQSEDNNSTRTSGSNTTRASDPDTPFPHGNVDLHVSAVGAETTRTESTTGHMSAVADSCGINVNGSWPDPASMLLQSLRDLLDKLGADWTSKERRPALRERCKKLLDMKKAKISTVDSSEDDGSIRTSESESARVPDPVRPCPLEGKSHFGSAAQETTQTQSTTSLLAEADLRGSNADRSWPDPATMPLRPLRELLEKFGANWTFKEKTPALRKRCQKLIEIEKAKTTIPQSEETNSITASESTGVPDLITPCPSDVNPHVSAAGAEIIQAQSTTGALAQSNLRESNTDGSWPDPATMPLQPLRDLLDQFGADWRFRERRPALRDRCQKLINMEKAKIHVHQSEDNNSTRTSKSESTGVPDPDTSFHGDIDSHVSAAGAGTTRTQSTTGHMFAVTNSGGSNVDGSWPDPTSMPLQSLRDLLDKLGADWTFKERRPALRERCQKLINMEKAKIISKEAVTPVSTKRTNIINADQSEGSPEQVWTFDPSIPTQNSNHEAQLLGDTLEQSPFLSSGAQNFPVISPDPNPTMRNLTHSVPLDEAPNLIGTQPSNSTPSPTLGHKTRVASWASDVLIADDSTGINMNRNFTDNCYDTHDTTEEVPASKVPDQAVLTALNSMRKDFVGLGKSVVEGTVSIATGIANLNDTLQALHHAPGQPQLLPPSRPFTCERGKDHDQRKSEVLLDAVREHCSTMFGRSLNLKKKKIPPPETAAERKRWIIRRNEEDLPESDDEATHDHHDGDGVFDPNFPYPDGPGHHSATPEALKIIWRMMRHAGVVSFRPNLARAMNAPCNRFLWDLAKKAFLELVASREYPLLTSEICAPDDVHDALVSHVQGHIMRTFREKTQWSAKERALRDKNRRRSSRHGSLRRWRLKEVLFHKTKLVGLIPVIEDLCSDDETDDEDLGGPSDMPDNDEDLAVSSDVQDDQDQDSAGRSSSMLDDDQDPGASGRRHRASSRVPKQCKILELPWRSPVITLIMIGLDQLRARRLACAGKRNTPPPRVRKRQDQPKISCLPHKPCLPIGFYNESWILKLSTYKLQALKSKLDGSPLNYYLAVIEHLLHY
ncbi:hypothetical protein Pst134EB_018537 [Puccinia striiformis f. sp. tritici]|nr:hypothetical protein Pst134EB_018537 [Puccinia striiformis f. sp. tritici]